MCVCVSCVAIVHTADAPLSDEAARAVAELGAGTRHTISRRLNAADIVAVLKYLILVQFLRDV